MPAKSAPAAAGRVTAKDLPPNDLAWKSPADVLHEHLLGLLKGLQAKGLSREEALANLFPNTVLPWEAYEATAAALFSGAHLLFFGPSGTGKTNLAKDLWEIFPKDIWIVDGCPVQDHPASLLDAKAAAEAPPCPTCVRRFSPDQTPEGFDPQRVDPSQVPVRRVRLREGFGFARLQGSSEVFPDHLTGNINLQKLEQLGDPMNPLVLEPGKLLQANRGFLLIDEIGKLPLGTQNVLLQALQEGMVTPAKSRESFPSRFVAVCTSNLSDLDNINDPLSDRLTSVHIEFNKAHGRNRRIVEIARPAPPPVWSPDVLLDAGVRVLEVWREKMSDDNPDVGEVGSNRTLIDVGFRTEAFAQIRGHPWPTYEDLQAGLLHAMRGRIRARSGDSFEQNSRLVSEFLDRNVEACVKRSATLYWCRFFRDRLKANRSEGEGVVSEGRRLAKDAALQAQVAGGAGLFPRFQEFTKWVGERERLPAGLSPTDAAVGAFALLDRFSLFSCEEGGDDHE